MDPLATGWFMGKTVKGKERRGIEQGGGRGRLTGNNGLFPPEFYFTLFFEMPRVTERACYPSDQLIIVVD